MAHDRTCMCGSGKLREAQYDARGIFLTYTCTSCHTKKMQGYRQEVLKNPDYEADEDIDGDDGVVYDDY